MEVKRLRTLGLEDFKTLNNLNPAFREEIFHRTKWLAQRANNIKVNIQKKPNFETLGSCIWSSLPENIKEETNFT